MSVRAAARTVLAGMVVLISFIPQAIVSPFLGEINLVFLLLLWIAFLALLRFLTRRQMFFTAAICAMLMAFPPVPNWMWYSNSGGLLLRFIGWSGLLREVYGIVFFFLLYLAIFISIVLLSRNRLRTDQLRC